MTRRGPLPDWTPDGPWTKSESGIGGFRATFPLRTITALVGGGVEPFKPDTVDIVRLPEVRGALRWWWRALFQARDLSAKELFQQEARLWGGVDVPKPEGGSENCRSRVVLDLTIRDKGQVVPSGRHPLRDGRLRAAPKWAEPDLGYALFPLQLAESERANATRELPTRDYRKGLRFELHVSLEEPSPAEAEQILWTVWAWVHLGGIGARTRRGFGALELSEPPRFSDPQSTAEFPQGVLESSWSRLQRQAAGGARLGDGARLIMGPRSRDAAAAHGVVVKALQTFRQGIGTGRRQGAGKPGHSNWPEADLIRRLAGLPTRDPIPATESIADRGAPRAAFGLPLQIKFKDRLETRADSTLVPVQGGRWSSPLILRPVPTTKGGYRPMALSLAGERPARVLVQERQTEVAVRSAVGAKAPISTHLGHAGGDAVDAFCSWLCQTEDFEEIS